MIFVDTSYFFALEFKNDQNHALAQKHWQALLSESPRLVTTTYVFDELITFLNSRGHHAKAVMLGNALLNSTLIECIQVDESLFSKGWDYFQRHSDKTYSLTDCISFAVMR